VIAFDVVQLRALASDVLRALEAAESVFVIDVHDLSDGAWLIAFEDRWPDTRFPAFEIEVQEDWSREGVAHELRTVLREKLWICPLCQRRAGIRRVVDTNVFRVECRQCGRFEIEEDVLELFRSGYERGDERLVRALPRLSEATRHARSPLSLGAETWQGLVGE
jgi:hypothetical protein